VRHAQSASPQTHTQPRPPPPSTTIDTTIRTPTASLAAAIVLSTLAALPILLIAVLALEVQEQGGQDGRRLFDDAIYYIHITAAVAGAWAVLCLALQAGATHHTHKKRSLPARHYPILALAACHLARAVVGAACHDAAATAAGATVAFAYLFFTFGAQLATVLAALGGARILEGQCVCACVRACAVVREGLSRFRSVD
jgi:hypothetical protein